MIRTHGRPSTRGFSLLELMVVVAIALVVAAVAIPQILIATQAFQLRSTASSVSGLVQKARMMAVARNGSFPVRRTTTGTVTTIHVELNSTTSLDSAEESASSLRLPRGSTLDTSGNPSAATIFTTSTPETTTLPQFNSRGLPCYLSSGVCSVHPEKMYITFLRQDRSFGGTGWAAINVTPAGRVQVWTWNGSNWE